MTRDELEALKALIVTSLEHSISEKSSGYNFEFEKAIRERQPRWFENTADTKKAQLLSLPVGCQRPNRRTHSLAGALNSYISPNSESYDAEFDKAIRERQPGWFPTPPTKKKEELLAMPVGCNRPAQNKHPLGYVLGHYTNQSSKVYDPEFDKAIRERQPKWFEDSMSVNKEELLAMPVGCKRPNKRKHRLGNVLGFYTNPSSKTYDPEFDKAIRKRQPQWFKRAKTKKER